ncbi:MAG TPA: TonB-dependent receptor [Chthoniobacteraceae bacterium]|nr:TonB-dependent receptor [Chthoniobacteraceae bacterium]
MAGENELLTTNRKALTINLDDTKYGTFAEIGAGQEVVRNFFQAGGAAGTVAKSISAYDMKFSDAIYGKSPRYVSHERLETMLDHEYALLKERLWEARSATTKFFVYANTVAARNYKGTNECHGWMGIRFQTEPQGEPSDIVIHVRMWDKENLLQQQALGVIGVNLVYGAFYLREDPKALVKSLADQLGIERIEVDMIKFSGPAFKQVNNRLMSLELVRLGLTNAVMFSADGDVVQPSEVLHNKAILVERGSFRPVTLVHMDMLRCACAQFAQEPGLKGKEVVVLMEITINNLLAAGQIDVEDFLARVDTLSALGHDVLISNYSEYYRLSAYFRRYTKEMVGIALGVNSLLELFNEKYYENLAGGILESFGRLFRNSVKLYVYPMRQDVFSRYLASADGADGADRPAMSASSFASNVLITARNVQVTPRLQNLYQHLLENHYIECLVGYDENVGNVFSRDEFKKIRVQDSDWEKYVPAKVAEIIKARNLFGYHTAAQ